MLQRAPPMDGLELLISGTKQLTEEKNIESTLSPVGVLSSPTGSEKQQTFLHHHTNSQQRERRVNVECCPSKSCRQNSAPPEVTALSITASRGRLLILLLLPVRLAALLRCCVALLRYVAALLRGGRWQPLPQLHVHSGIS